MHATTRFTRVSEHLQLLKISCGRWPVSKYHTKSGRFCPAFSTHSFCCSGDSLAPGKAAVIVLQHNLSRFEGRKTVCIRREGAFSTDSTGPDYTLSRVYIIKCHETAKRDAVFLHFFIFQNIGLLDRVRRYAGFRGAGKRFFVDKGWFC